MSASGLGPQHFFRILVGLQYGFSIKTPNGTEMWHGCVDLAFQFPVVCCYYDHQQSNGRHSELSTIVSTKNRWQDPEGISWRICGDGLRENWRSVIRRSSCRPGRHNLLPGPVPVTTYYPAGLHRLTLTSRASPEEKTPQHRTATDHGWQFRTTSFEPL